MLSSAFKGAYTNQIAQQNQGINTITQGVKDAAILAAAVTGFSGGFGTSSLGKTVASGSEHALAGRIGGIGGNIMLATLKEKQGSAQAKQATEQMYSQEDITNVISSQLGSNPINNSAKKQLSTVFEKLTQVRESGIINKKGNIESSMGEIDPNSELGKKIMGGI